MYAPTTVRRLCAAIAGAALLLGLLVVGPPPAGAQTTFTVSANRLTGSPATDDPAPDGNCNSDCTLREAVQAANATPGAQIITFAAPGTVALGRTGTEAGNASFNDLDVTDDLTVVGHPDGTTITTAAFNGDDPRAFEVTDRVLELRGLLIMGTGGGVLATRSQVTVTDSTFEGNTAIVGGAIELIGGSLTIASSTFRDNIAFLGGALFVTNQGPDGPLPGTAPVQISDSSFTGNAGVAVLVATGVDLHVSRSSFSTNRARSIDGTDFGGGAILAQADAAGLAVVNTTFSDNLAVDPRAGAIEIISFSLPPPGNPPPDKCVPDCGRSRTETSTRQGGPLVATVTHATIVDNGGAAQIVNGSASASLSLASSIVAGNGDANCGPAGITSAGSNLEDVSDCPFTQPGDVQDTAPMLAALAAAGGPPQGADGAVVGLVRPLLPGSPAIDTADPARCPAPVGTDQRGVIRPQLGGCDKGAFELEEEGAGTVTITKDVAPGAIQPDGTATFTIVVTNVSGSPVADVGMVDVMPDGLAIQSVTPTAACPAPTGQTITCDLGDLADGQAMTIGVVVTGSTPGNYLNTATATVAGAPVDDDDASLVVATGDSCTGVGADGNAIPEGLVRIQGLNRIQTSVAASQAACGDGEAPAIVLTRSDLFPDAQAGTPLAVSLGAPLLLSSPDALSPEAEVEMQRVLGPGGTVYLLGGIVALSDAVRARIELLGYTTIRYGGQNRFGTAAIIADQGLANPSTLLVANGGDFADSIVAGAAASSIDEGGAVGAAVLLTSGADIPPETQGYLDALAGPAPTMITIGATAGQAFPAVENISGASRFETSTAVARRFFTTPPIVGIARADDFADGLTGGTLVGRQLYGPGPILLTATDSLPATLQAYLSENAPGVTRALVFGGTAAVSAETENQIRSALGLS